MMSRSVFPFVLVFLSLSKYGNANLMMQTLKTYILHPAKNTTLLISGSVVTLNSLNQWNIFDIKYILGANVEQMMIVNILAICQFFLGWRAIATKPKSETNESDQEINSKITTLQSEIYVLKSKLGAKPSEQTPLVHTVATG